MNRKGQSMGSIIMVFIVAIVGITLMIAAAQDVGGAVNSISETNLTITSGAVGVAQDIQGQSLLSTPVVTNATALLNSTDFTMEELVSTTTGVLTISFTPLESQAASQTINITYDYGDDGYIDDSGGRALASLIIIFFGLAIAVIALEPTLRSGILSVMGK